MQSAYQFFCILEFRVFIQTSIEWRCSDKWTSEFECNVIFNSFRNKATKKTFHKLLLLHFYQPTKKQRFYQFFFEIKFQHQLIPMKLICLTFLRKVFFHFKTIFVLKFLSIILRKENIYEKFSMVIMSAVHHSHKC